MVTRSKQIASSLCRDIIIQSLSDKEREAWFATKNFVRKNFIYYTQYSHFIVSRFFPEDLNAISFTDFSPDI